MSMLSKISSQVGLALSQSSTGFEPHGFLGCRGGGQAKRGRQGREGGVQFVRGLGVQQEQGGIVVAVRPGILHGGSGFADAAHAVHRFAGDRGGAAVGAGEAGVQAVQEGLAAFEQGADGGIVEVDGFRGQVFKYPGRNRRLQRAAQKVLQNLRPEFVHAADQGPLRAGRLDVSNER